MVGKKNKSRIKLLPPASLLFWRLWYLLCVPYLFIFILVFLHPPPNECQGRISPLVWHKRATFRHDALMLLSSPLSTEFFNYPLMHYCRKTFLFNRKSSCMSKPDVEVFAAKGGSTYQRFSSSIFNSSRKTKNPKNQFPCIIFITKSSP